MLQSFCRWIQSTVDDLNTLCQSLARSSCPLPSELANRRRVCWTPAASWASSGLSAGRGRVGIVAASNTPANVACSPLAYTAIHSNTPTARYGQSTRTWRDSTQSKTISRRWQPRPLSKTHRDCTQPQVSGLLLSHRPRPRQSQIPSCWSEHATPRARAPSVKAMSVAIGTPNRLLSLSPM